MTLQTILNTSTAALVKQGKRSADADGFCMFRDPDGNKCAVGHLIPDADYDPLFDKPLGENGFGNRHVLELYAEKLDVPAHFLQALQLRHDNAKNPETFVADFLANVKDLAILYNLEMPNVEV